MNRSITNLIDEVLIVIELSDLQIRTVFKEWGYYGYDIKKKRLIEPMSRPQMATFSKNSNNTNNTTLLDHRIWVKQLEGVQLLISEDQFKDDHYHVLGVSLDRFHSFDTRSSNLKDLLVYKQIVIVTQINTIVRKHYVELEKEWAK